MANIENVNHPNHYGGDQLYEHIKVCYAWGLGYALGNATKYICRAGKKTESPLEDLRKAAWYLDYEIKRLELLESNVKSNTAPRPPTGNIGSGNDRTGS